MRKHSENMAAENMADENIVDLLVTENIAVNNNNNRGEKQTESNEPEDPVTTNKEKGCDDKNENHGAKSCLNCDRYDDQNMILCSECKGWYHYSCTKLWSYQIHVFIKKHRKFTCAKCVEVSKELYNNCFDKEYEDLQATIALITQDKTDAENKLKCLEAELNYLRNQSVIKTNEHKAKLSDLQNEKSKKLSQELENANNKVLRLEKQLTESNKKNAELIREMKEITKNKQPQVEPDNERINFQKQIEEKEQQIRELEKLKINDSKKKEMEMKKIRDETNKYKEKVEELSKENITNNKTIAHLNDSLDNLKTVNKKLELTMHEIEKTTSDSSRAKDDTPKTRTAECFYYTKYGHCKKQDDCKYVHKDKQKKDKSSNSLPCKYFEKNGWCKFSEQCKYKHTCRPLCKHFQNGNYCRYGKSCKYRHFYNKSERKYTEENIQYKNKENKDEIDDLHNKFNFLGNQINNLLQQMQTQQYYQIPIHQMNALQAQSQQHTNRNPMYQQQNAQTHQ